MALRDLNLLIYANPLRVLFSLMRGRIQQEMEQKGSLKMEKI
jgi:hypothetical protein